MVEFVSEEFDKETTRNNNNNDDIEASNRPRQRSEPSSSSSWWWWWWGIKKLQHHYQVTIGPIPNKYKWLFLVIWIGWKVVVLVLLYYFARPSHNNNNNNTLSLSSKITWVPSILPKDDSHSFMASQPIKLPLDNKNHEPLVRVLYIVTTLMDEHNHNEASLYRVLPGLRHNVATILEKGRYHVDLAWILLNSNEDRNYDGGGKQLDTTQIQLLARQAFPPQVGFTLWPHANPLVLDPTTGKLELQNPMVARQLQPWWLIRDTFSFYHLFLVWPDNARILGSHVDHFWTLSQQLELLQQQQQQQNYHDPNIQWKYHHYIPALLPIHSGPKQGSKNLKNNFNQSLSLPKKQQLDESHRLQMALSWNGQVTRGPWLYSKNDSDPTVVISAPALSQSPGFMVTRSQLGQAGFLACLFPWYTTDIPVARANNPHQVRHDCLPPGPGLVLAHHVMDHMVQMLEETDREKPVHWEPHGSLADFQKLVQELIDLEPPMTTNL